MNGYVRKLPDGTWGFDCIFGCAEYYFATELEAECGLTIHDCNRRVFA